MKPFLSNTDKQWGCPWALIFASLPNYCIWSIAKLHLPSLNRGLHRGKATPVTLSSHRKDNIWEGLNRGLCLNSYYWPDMQLQHLWGGWSPMSQNSHCPTELTPTDPWAISWMSTFAVIFSLAQMCTSIDEFTPFKTKNQNEINKPNTKQLNPNPQTERMGIS